MSRNINGKPVSDTETSAESFPDAFTLSGTSAKRAGTGKKSVLFNLNESDGSDNSKEVRHATGDGSLSH
jgi:hypothetical protein